MSDTVLRLEGVDVGHTAVPVVRGLDLHVDAGEVVALLGPNGAGKTTTLLAISGLLPCLRGEITVTGRPTAGMAPYRIARLGVGHVTEDRSLFDQLTVEENLLLGRRRGRPDLEQVFRYFPALRVLLRRRAGLLSGGEQRMLALGRAFVSSPRVLVVDELSLGLAPVILDSLMPSLRRLAAETGCAVLMVEQHVPRALEIADRAYLLSHGDLVFDGTAADLAGRPEMVEAAYLGALVVAEE